MDILQDVDAFTRSLILIGAEIILIVLWFILAATIVRFIFIRIGSIPALQKYLGLSERAKKRIKAMVISLCIFACITLLGYNGFLLYKQIDVYLHTLSVYQHTLSLLAKIPVGFWSELLTRLGKTIGLALLAHYAIKQLLKLLSKAEDMAKSYEHLKSNDASIASFFTKLRQLLKNSVWFLVILYAAHSLFLPSTINNALFVIFKIYLITAIGFLVVRAVTATVDSLKGLSKKYWYRESYLDWYNRFSGLMPLFRRCLEYIIYVWATSLVLLQVNFIAQFASYGPSVVQIIGIFFIARMVVEVVNLLVDKYMLPTDENAESPNKQQQTLTPIIKTVLQYIIYFIAFVLMLRAVDINPLPLLAGAGILGIVVGLGAQSLINDLVAGFFILFEGLFLVGDYIETTSARGIVEAIHIRTTMVRDPNGQLHILRNGQINSVVNFSKEYTYAVVEVGVAYDSDLDHVFQVLTETGLQLKEKNHNVLEPLKVQGLKEFGESELLIRTLTKVRPGCHFRVAFELRAMIKNAFDQEGIEIPFPRRVVIFKKDINNQPETT